MRENGFTPEEGVTKGGRKREMPRRTLSCDETPPVIHEKVVYDQSPRESARKKGDLEKRYKDIEPLPPTPISDDARDQLLSWGATEEEITELCELTSSFRYDLCEKKAARLTENPAYLHTTNDGVEEIIIPDYFVTSDRGDGACRDLAVQWIRAFNHSKPNPPTEKSLFDSIRSRFTRRKEQPEEEAIVPLYMSGKSRTHFFGDGSQHVFAGLMREGGTISADSPDIVIVDPSFQQIITAQESGYQFEPDDVGTNPSFFTGYNAAATISLGKLYTEEDGSWQAEVEDAGNAVIGITNDFQDSCYFTFVRDVETAEIKPFLQFKDAQENVVVSYTYDRKGKIVWSSGGRELSDTYQFNAMVILHHLNKIQIIEDAEKAEALKNEESSVSVYGDWEYQSPSEKS